MSRWRRWVIAFLTLGALAAASAPLQAKYFGADPPVRCNGGCAACQGNAAAGPGGNCSASERCATGSCFSRTEGNQKESYAGAAPKGGSGSLPALTFTYNSYNADTSRARLDTVLGNGWTHSYNVFLYSVRGHLFRVDGEGRITKYKLGPGGSFTAAPGYFETFARNPDGSFTLRQKDGTVYRFAEIPGTPFLLGTPVYQLTQITDRNGNALTYSYSAGLLSQVTDPYGRSLSFSYTAQKKLAAVTDALGRSTRFSYDASGAQLQAITDPAGKTTQYSYNFLFQLTRKVDRDGRVYSYGYQGNEPVSLTDGAGQPYFTLSNPGNWATNDTVLAQDMVRQYVPGTTSKVDGRGNLWSYGYDANGYVTQMRAPDGATWRYSYDAGTLMPVTETDANNRTTSYRYDSRGNLIGKTDALGFVSAYTYEPVFNQVTSMTDANGRVMSYQYDARGNRIQETDALARTRQWTYDARGNVTSEKDKNGNVTGYQYDAFGQRVKVTDALGNVTTLTYDAMGNVLTRTNARGFTTSYQYDALDRLTGETDALGKVTQSFYDGEGDRTRVIDRNGNATTYQYDQRRRLVNTIDALNQMTTQSYDANNNRVTVTDRNNHTTSLQYDVQNRPVKSVDALGNTTTMSYDPVGNKLTDTDANGHATTYQYDALNRLVKRTDAEANVAQMFYDMVGGCAACTGPARGSNRVTERIDAEGKVTYFKYDGLDRLIVRNRKQADTADAIDGDDAVTRHTYDAQGNRLSITEPNGNTMTYVYDALDRQVKMMNAAGDVTMTSYDPVSNVATVTAANLNVTTKTYDALDRLIQVDDSVGRAASYTYDNVGSRLTEKDGNGNGNTNAYDALYRVTDVTDALGRSSHYDYDPVGNLLKLTDREGNVFSHLYDNINRRTQMTDALGNLTQFQYDAVGNVTRIIDANGHATDYAFDNIDRRVRETYADGRFRTHTYDRVGNLESRTDQKGQETSYVYSDLYFLLKRDYPIGADDNMTYDLSGRMLSAERGGWVVSFAYDGANRVTQTVQNGKTLTYSYNIPGRTRAVTYPGGRTITETTDARARLGTIDDAGSPPPIVRYSYDPGNRVVARDYRNGTTASYGYNANNWTTSVDHTRGATRVAGFAHDFDNEGIKRYEEKLADAGNSQTRSEAYQYDKLHRLIDYKVGTLAGSTVPVPVTQTQYELDAVGNWNRKTRDAIPETRTHSVVNEITQIGPVAVASDPDGNTAEDGLYRYAYDEENRLSAVTRKSDSAVVGRYAYDALSRRIVKIAEPAGTAATTAYFYDDARIVEEQNGAGITQATYVYGNYIDEILTMDRLGQPYYYHQNSLWSVGALSDGGGNVVERYTYDAYGLPGVLNAAGVPLPINAWGTAHSPIGNPFLFTGRQLDEESGVYYYRARYHDPVKGRFLQRDPLEFQDGMNLYAYVDDSPTTRADPLGLLTWKNNPVVETTVNASATIEGRKGRTTLQKEKAWAITVPRLYVSGLCACPNRWPVENVEVESVTVNFHSEVFLLERYELKGVNPDEIRAWVRRAEEDHVRDFLAWADTKGKKLAETAERQLKQRRYRFLSDCAKDAEEWMDVSLRPSLESAAENTIRTWDDPPPRRHDPSRYFLVR